MEESNFDSQSRSPEREVHGEGEERMQFSWSVEGQLLQSISALAPLPKILNEICIALDCHVGNVVSLITLPGGDPREATAIASNAERFGLHSFYCEEVVAGDGEPLGSLEMYCSPRRSPSAGELQFIERAKCLAAIAIKCHKDAAQPIDGGRSPNGRTQGRLLGWPVPMN
jgi:hypothetical protein